MKILGVIALVLLGMYGCYHSAAPSATIRYKLTLTVDDNGKQYTGSSVVEVYRQDTTKVFGSMGGYGYSFRGEAVAVILGEKGILFSLLKDNYSGTGLPPYLLLNAFNMKLGASDVIDLMRNLDKERPRPKVQLEFHKLPMLVHYRDINDPKTVELVDPNDLEKTFGKGVKLVSATLEITDGPMTSEIRKYMPSFDKKTGYSEWVKSLSYGDFKSIYEYDFISGGRQ